MMMAIVLNKTSDAVNTLSVYYILPEQVYVFFFRTLENFEGTLMNATEKFIFVNLLLLLHLFSVSLCPACILFAYPVSFQN